MDGMKGDSEGRGERKRGREGKGRGYRHRMEERKG
jgi:hypothetical protein